MQISILGTGNVATVLGKSLKAADHEIVQVYGRDEAAANALAKELGAEAVVDLHSVKKHVDLLLMAISDSAIAKIAEELHVDHVIVAHTAGSVSKEVLQKMSKNYGVFYPLQSLRKEMQVMPDIPLLIDGNTAEVQTLLFDVAKDISTQVQLADDATRLKLHLAAVLVSNFTNHLFALADAYCIQENVDFKMLQPLMEETVLRLRNKQPNQVQTGPAIRHDQSTIDLHLQMLQSNPHLQNVYALLTKSIQEKVD
jgi:predicted short-subunit dehydrogenase-like oxidoreductase (DUF2520 family)